MRIVIASAFTAALLSSNVAGADSFALNGAFTTSGVFTCLRSLACAGSGTNSVTLGSGSNTATLTFNGVDTTVAIRNVKTPLSLGQFETVSSPGFTFPTRPNPNVAILRFDFTIHHTSPVDDANHVWMTFGPGGKGFLPQQLGQSYTSFRLDSLGSLGPGRNYPAFIYSFKPNPFRIAGNGTTDFSANVGVVPEPATMLLVGGGLAGLVARRRKQRQAQAC